MKKIKTHRLVIGTLLSVLIPLISVSCEIKVKEPEDKKSMIDVTSDEDHIKQMPTVDKEEFLVSNYFSDLSIKNEKNLTIDEWINQFNKDLGVDVSKPFSFNRTLATDKIDAGKYVNKSAEIIKNIIEPKYLKNSIKNINDNFAYDIRLTKEENNKITFAIFIFNPNLQENNVINQNFTLDFVFVNPLKIYEQLKEPTSSGLLQLEQLKTIKDNEKIKTSYDNLLTWIQKSQVIIKSKNNDKNLILQTLDGLIKAINAILENREILSQQKSIASLYVEIENQKVFLNQNSKNETIPEVKTLANKLRDSLEEAQNYIDSGNSAIPNILELKRNLSNVRKELDREIESLPIKLDNFLKNFLSKVEVTGVRANASRRYLILPSELKQSNFSVRNTIPGAQIEFTILPNNSFGRILLGANVTYGKLSRTISPERYSFAFNFNTEVNKYFSSTFLSDSYSINVLKKWPENSEKFIEQKNIIDEIRLKLFEILNESLTPETEFNRLIKRDRVATFMWALEFYQSNDKVASLEKVRTNLLNLNDESNKLLYIIRDIPAVKNKPVINPWKMFKLFSKFVAYSNSITTSNADFNSLDSYRDSELNRYVIGWTRDYFRFYFNSRIKPNKDNVVLFEIIQPYNTIDVYQILSKIIEKESNNSLKSDFFDVLKHYVFSVGVYPKVNDSVSELSGLIDNPDLAFYSFVSKLFTTIESNDINEATKDAQNFKHWLENVDYKILLNKISLNPPKLLEYITNLLKQTTLYEKYSEHGSNFGFQSTNFDALISWFFDNYLRTVNLDKINSIEGINILETIVMVFRILSLNINYQQDFISKLQQNPLFKDKKSVDFSKIISLRPSSILIWEGILLKKF